MDNLTVKIAQPPSINVSLSAPGVLYAKSINYADSYVFSSGEEIPNAIIKRDSNGYANFTTSRIDGAAIYATATGGDESFAIDVSATNSSNGIIAYSDLGEAIRGEGRWGVIGVNNGTSYNTAGVFGQAYAANTYAVWAIGYNDAHGLYANSYNGIGSILSSTIGPYHATFGGSISHGQGYQDIIGVKSAITQNGNYVFFDSTNQANPNSYNWHTGRRGTLTYEPLSANRIWSLPNQTGTILLDSTVTQYAAPLVPKSGNIILSVDRIDGTMDLPLITTLFAPGPMLNGEFQYWISPSPSNGNQFVIQYGTYSHNGGGYTNWALYKVIGFQFIPLAFSQNLIAGNWTSLVGSYTISTAYELEEYAYISYVNYQAEQVRQNSANSINSLSTNRTFIDHDGGQNIVVKTASDNGLTIIGANAQTGNLQQWNNADVSKSTYITAEHNFNVYGTLSAANFTGSSSGINSGDQTVTLTGDVTGSGTGTFTATLKSVGTAGTYNNSATTTQAFTTDAQGRITGTSVPITIAPAWTNIASKPTTISGFGITDAVTLSGNQTIGGVKTFTSTISASNLSGTNTGDQTVTLTGDVTGSGTGTFTTTLKSVGTAGTYNNSATQTQSFTTDSQGRVSSTGIAVTITPSWASVTGTPTTVSGYGITDAVTLSGTQSINGSKTFLSNISAPNLSGTNTGDQTVTLTGDVTGSGTGSFSATLKSVGTAGTYNNSATTVQGFTTDAQGRVSSTITPITITPAWTSISGKPTTISGYGITDAVTLAGDQTIAGVKTFTSSISALNFTGSSSGTNTGDQTITLTGDVTGSGTNSFGTTLKSVGTAGTYNNSATTTQSFTTDAQGRVSGTGALLTITPSWSNVTSKPTTVSGFGITDAVTLAGDQTIAGVKTFNSSPLVPNLTLASSSLAAVNKAYVDDIAAGIHVHTEVHVILKTATLSSATGGTVAYTNGTDGVGAKLTVTGGTTIITGLNAICGTDPDLTTGSRVLIAGETNAAWNGIYTITADRELTRATDFDSAIDMSGGDFVFVTHGTVYADTGWICSEPVTTVGTSPVIFVQFSGSGTYDAGNGLQRDGTIFSVKGTTGRIAVSAAGVDLATQGTAGTYRSVTTDAYGRVTSGTNPTTLSGYGITDAAALSGAAFTGNVSSTGTVTGTNLIYDGGNTNAAALYIGTNDANKLAFETNAAERVTILSNGNVGIGNTNPSQKLQVSGNALITSVSTWAAGEIARLYFGDTGHSLSVPFSNAATWSNYNGINFTNSSGTSLSIGAGSGIGGNLNVGVGGILAYNASATLQVRGGGTTSATAALNATNSADSSLLFVRNDGNIGIGTTTPAAKLDIVDTVLAGSGSLNGSAINIAQTWNTSGTPTAIKLNVTDTASNASSLFADLQVGGVSKFNVKKNGDLTINGSTDQAVRLAGDAYSATVVAGALTFTASATRTVFKIVSSEILRFESDLTIKIPAAVPLIWGGDTYITRKDTRSLRLGQADAATPLPQTLGVQSATGTANVAGATFTIAGSQGTGSGAGGSIVFQTAPAGTANLTAPNALVDRLTITSNGNVGIGVSGPSANTGEPLYISNIFSFTNTTFLRIDNTNTNGSHGIRLGAQNTKADFYYDNATTQTYLRGIGSALNIGHFGGNSDGYLAFTTFQQERMRILSGGNVGIGTTTPAEKLSVVGNINATGNLTLGTALTIANGGTGATTDSAARTNLGLGSDNSPTFAGLSVTGHFSAVTKSFLIDHPTKQDKKLQYGVVESDQHSVFVRGKTNQSIINLPEEWIGLVHADSVTVHLTPIGKFQGLFVVSQDNATIEVGGNDGYYNYTVYGERKDVDKLQVEI